MNKLALLLLTLMPLGLFAYSDYDMDGVEDAADKCPNTPFSELVDDMGCGTQSLVSPHHYDIIYGVNFYQSDYQTLEKADTLSQSLQLDYYYKNFSLQASSSYYTSQDNSGMNDSFLGAYYKIKQDNGLNIRLGAGIILPTYQTDLYNNDTDYTASVNLSYMHEGVNIFGGYGYTIINDSETNASIIGTKTSTKKYVYNNTDSFNIGLGFYPQKRLYVSGSYNTTQSMYTGEESIDTASLYGFYTIDENWFASFSYGYGLSSTASDNSASLRLGYYF
ncbi:DUF3187 domain-containing protein [bacterium]|nr:DUF3187 domain-containing protein [bacterium]MBU1989576.1 DUF3187 domain-containing protein [bacterium]